MTTEPPPSLPPGAIARTRALPQDLAVDLLAIARGDGLLFARDGRGFAACGRRWTIPRRRASEALGHIEADDEIARPGSGPVAFGALPFQPDPTAPLHLAALTVVLDDDGTAWATSIEVPGGSMLPPDPVAQARAALDRGGRPSPADGPSSFTVTAARPPRAWQDAVETATERIRRNELDKVVLAREVTVTADADLSIATIVLRLSQQYSGCYLYLVDGFCGASPELLVGRRDDVVRAQPMAGTAPRRNDPEADAALAAALLADPTYRHEHQVTIDAVHDGLLSFSSYIDYEPEPSVVPLANVVHLATRVEGRLSHPPASILELVDALHPTPAVCGRPRDVALATIDELEHLDRGRYAGAVGWVDGRGNGEWAVSIRGAEISGPTARIIAGNGMVGDSDPATELVETRAKLQAMLSAIVRP